MYSGHSISEIELSTQTRNRFTIGRNQDCDVILSHPTVLGVHAVLKYTNIETPMVSIHARPGTSGFYYNGCHMIETAINPHCCVRISIFRIQFIVTRSSIVIRVWESPDQYQIQLHNISYCVKKHQILKEVDLILPPGQFIGIMGPSGSGKSTLLKLICHYASPSDGRIQIGDLDLRKNFDHIKSFMGYVPQDDIIYSDLSVRESLEYAALLKLPKDTTKDQRDELIVQILDQLDLSRLCNQLVRSLSGGQRKRVSIAVEMLNHPKVLIMDEPDSGLDPHIRAQLMTELRHHVESGATVIVTTHSPENFINFDKVILVAQGRLVFFGKPQEAFEFFELSEGEGDVRKIYEKLEGIDKTKSEEKLLLAEHYSHNFKKSNFFMEHYRNQGPIEIESHQSSHIAKTVDAVINIIKSINARRTLILFDRHLNLQLGKVREFWIHLLIPIAVLIMFGAHDIKTTNELKDMAELQKDVVIELVKPEDSSDTNKTEPINQSGVPLFARMNKDQKRLLLTPKIPHLISLTMVLTAIFCGTFLSCTEISQERNIYLRERKLFLTIPEYLLSKLPMLFGITFVQMSILLIGTIILKDLRAVRIIEGILLLSTCAWCSVSMGLMLSSLDKTGKNSILLSILVLIPQIIFSGAIAPDFYLNMNPVAKLISNGFVSRWGFHGMATVFNDEKLVSWGPDILEHQLGFAHWDIIWGISTWPIIGILLTMTVIFLCLTGVILKTQNHS